MKKLMYVFAVAIMAVIAQSCEPVPDLAQKGAVTGIVTDATTGEPIAGCEVYLSRYTSAERIAVRDYYDPIQPSMVLTDSLGSYQFTHLYLGTYGIYAVADGYVLPENVEVLLTSDNDDDWLEVDFQLVKEE